MPQTEQLNEQALLNQAIQDLEPQVPIRNWRRDENILTLYLADGRVIAYDWQERHVAADGVTVPAGDMSQLTKSDLMEIAQDVDLPGRSTMSKTELVQALEELRDD